MVMNAQQEQAFSAATGNGMAPAVLNMLCIGVLIAVLFVWAAWGLVDVYQGWVNEKVATANLIRFAIRSLLLLVVCIWMFAS